LLRRRVEHFGIYPREGRRDRRRPDGCSHRAGQMPMRASSTLRCDQVSKVPATQAWPHEVEYDRQRLMVIDRALLIYCSGAVAMCVGSCAWSGGLSLSYLGRYLQNPGPYPARMLLSQQAAPKTAFQPPTVSLARGAGAQSLQQQAKCAAPAQKNLYALYGDKVLVAGAKSDYEFAQDLR
jgi:hypothetical protein